MGRKYARMAPAGLILLVVFAVVLTGCGGKNGGASKPGKNTPSPEDASVGGVSVLPEENPTPVVSTAVPRPTGVVQIVATTGLIADVARTVGGERVEVTQLIDAGVDPHTYTADEADLEAIRNAEIVFYNGLSLETGLVTAFEQLRMEGTAVIVAVCEQLPPQLVLFSSGAPDPHVWQDAERWSIVVDVVRDTLVGHDLLGQSYYDASADAYILELSDLDAWVQTNIATIPEAQRNLVTGHMAFQYFGDAYRMQVFAPLGADTAQSASPESIQAAVDFVVNNQVRAVFAESSLPGDTIDAVIQGAQGAGANVSGGGVLYADSLGASGSAEGTYLGMIKYNVRTIVTALGGTVSE